MNFDTPGIPVLQAGKDGRFDDARRHARKSSISAAGNTQANTMPGLGEFRIGSSGMAETMKLHCHSMRRRSPRAKGTTPAHTIRQPADLHRDLGSLANAIRPFAVRKDKAGKPGESGPLWEMPDRSTLRWPWREA